MSDSTPHETRGGPELPRRVGPRSPVWQWLLGSSSAAAYALLFGLANSFVQNSFEDNALVVFLSGTLDVLTVLVLLLAAGFVGRRVMAGFRERRRIGRDLALTAHLIAPGPRVFVPKSASESADASSDEGEADVRELGSEELSLAQALHYTIPIETFDTDALIAIYTAMVNAPARIPIEQPGEPWGTNPLTILNKLVVAKVLRPTRAGWYQRAKRPPRLPESPSKAEPDAKAEQPDDIVRDSALRMALPAFVRHHSDLATRWARALDTRRLSEGAQRWFEIAGPYLSELITKCAKLEKESEHKKLTTDVIRELGRIADALDVWYARIGEPEPARAVAREMGVIAGDSFPIMQTVADLRSGPVAERTTPARYAPRRLAASLRARWDHEYALGQLVATEPRTREEEEKALKEIENRLEDAWWHIPREDVSGEVCALVNLAVVHLKQGRLEAAQDRLELAESLTRPNDDLGGRDPSGRAHVFETFGIVYWAQGVRTRAIACWQRALGIYRALDEKHGVGRCLQHLGSALVVAPELGGLLLAGPTADAADDGAADHPSVADLPLTEQGVICQATGWLRESSLLHRNGELVQQYLDIAKTRLGGLPTLTKIDRWPNIRKDTPEPDVLARRRRWVGRGR